MMIDPLTQKGLIIKILSHYKCYADRFSNVDYQDMIQESWIIVLIKIKEHNPDKGAVTTFLWPWINDAMQKYIKHRSVYRRPIRKGFTLNDYILISKVFDEDKSNFINHSPELELEARQEVFIKIKDYHQKNKSRKVKNSRFIEIEGLLAETA